MSLLLRPRRNRKSAAIRSLVRENELLVSDLVAPLFVKFGKKIKEPIPSMPGQFRFSIDMLLEEINELQKLGIKAVALFPVIDERFKDAAASESTNPKGIYLKAISAIKESYPEIVVISDVAMDPYSSDGHDGYYDKESGEILNDDTLEILADMAVAQAKAGADIVAPSDMMDGRVGVIREALDDEGFYTVSILSYTAKYASAFYGPFRDALSSAPKKGDKKTYQMDPANSKEAIREAMLDEEEGADILMVKPGLPYLDVISLLNDECELPIAAYQVSGEYAMIKAAAQNGWIDEKASMIEALLAFKRAGASIIFTYFAKEAAQILIKK